MKIVIFFTIFLLSLGNSLMAQKDSPDLNLKNYREVPAKWDRELLKQDMESMPITDTLVTGAFPIGVFPVPDYDSIKKGFNGVGNISNYDGVKIGNKNVVYNSFYYSEKGGIVA